MKMIVIEVGSTCTKIDLCENDEITRLDMITIQFKKNYKLHNCLDENDVETLINKVKSVKEKYNTSIYACGTSIFRTLEENEKEEFLARFYKETGYSFHIISQDQENELTVCGATRFVNEKVTVFIGGGGSTEIATYENKKIKEMVNSKIGVIDVMNEFQDLADDLATTSIEKVKGFVKARLNLPKERSDILILAGGGHELFARESGIKYEENTIYKDKASSIMMDIETRKKESTRYYEEISLDEIRNKSKDPDWWYATRAMCAFVLVVAEEIGAKYIVPTDISMVYGIMQEFNK